MLLHQSVYELITKLKEKYPINLGTYDSYNRILSIIFNHKILEVSSQLQELKEIITIERDYNQRHATNDNIYQDHHIVNNQRLIKLEQIQRLLQEIST